MYCMNCGSPIPEGANHCPKCGASVGNGFDKMGKFVNDVADKIDSEADRVMGSVDNAFNQGSNQNGIRLLKTDRSLLIFLLLNFITCGIYTFFFIHSIANDVNEACRNDSEKTPGAGIFILLWFIGIILGSFIGLFNQVDVQRTIYEAQGGNVAYIVSTYSRSAIPALIVSIITGIYPLYWRYKLGNKLQRNGERYGLFIPENGSSVLIWDLIGIICCCFCSWYALYIVIKNSNAVCMAYNNRYVLNK